MLTVFCDPVPTKVKAGENYFSLRIAVRHGCPQEVHRFGAVARAIVAIQKCHRGRNLRFAFLCRLLCMRIGGGGAISLGAGALRCIRGRIIGF